MASSGRCSIIAPIHLADKQHWVLLRFDRRNDVVHVYDSLSPTGIDGQVRAFILLLITTLVMHDPVPTIHSCHCPLQAAEEDSGIARKVLCPVLDPTAKRISMDDWIQSHASVDTIKMELIQVKSLLKALCEQTTALPGIRSDQLANEFYAHRTAREALKVCIQVDPCLIRRLDASIERYSEFINKRAGACVFFGRAIFAIDATLGEMDGTGSDVEMLW
ncbi:unnamed protein product [Colletotrichum noveboracense]|uniref:Ubiquitin-like protease family profile domain-containing protein n=1 Tax=Colletotrichum noveboracense TaxID=2664923 RepID=A0A9W4RZR8_9PEZI|nr:unnamed protein product [Colletotrichum noveboracense]